jgi:hypothetical protein
MLVLAMEFSRGLVRAAEADRTPNTPAVGPSEGADLTGSKRGSGCSRKTEQRLSDHSGFPHRGAPSRGTALKPTKCELTRGAE